MLFASALALAFAAAVKAQMSFDAWSIAQCQTSPISWSPTTAPYYVAVLPAENPCESDAIYEFHDVWDNKVDQLIKLYAGQQVVIYVEDANDQEFWSQAFTVGGGDSSCFEGYVEPQPEASSPPPPQPETPAPVAEDTPDYTGSYDLGEDTVDYSGGDYDAVDPVVEEQEEEPVVESYVPPTSSTPPSTFTAPAPASTTRTLDPVAGQEDVPTSDESEVSDIPANVVQGSAANGLAVGLGALVGMTTLVSFMLA